MSSRRLIVYGIMSLLCKLKTLFPTPHLSDWYFQIEFSTTTSNYFPIQSGVPQGSVLGPLLYVVIPSDIRVKMTTQLPRDTAIISTNEDPQTASENLRYHLNILQVRLDKWKIRVKLRRTKFKREVWRGLQIPLFRSSRRFWRPPPRHFLDILVPQTRYKSRASPHPRPRTN